MTNRHPGYRIVAVAALSIALMLAISACWGDQPFSYKDTAATQDADYTEPLQIISRGAAHNFVVERATTPKARATGLMYRTSMPENAGMIFLFEVARPATMWMKNTYISLDMLFLDGDGVIVEIHENAVPQSTEIIRTQADVKAIVELNAGTVKRLGLTPGDSIRHAVFGDSIPARDAAP